MLVSVLADLTGFQRPERWLEFAILVAAAATADLLVRHPQQAVPTRARPAWTILGVAVLVVLVVVTLRLEFVPLAVWLMLGSQRSWAWSSALAWAAVLALVPLWTQFHSPVPSGRPATPLEMASEVGGPGASGLVDLDSLYNTAAGDAGNCPWGHPWNTTVSTNGRIRPLFGLYGDTSHSAEFLLAEVQLRGGLFNRSGRTRPHWFEAWDEAGRPSLESPARAEALGASWYAECDVEGDVSLTELPGLNVTGVTVTPHREEESWHQAAVRWWMSADQVPLQVPVLWSNEAEDRAHPPTQAARGVSLQNARDSLTVRAQEAGWVWLRVPWDPGWRSADGAPILKGGPGHLVVWAERGTTELNWSVPRAVDAAAAAITGTALLATSMLLIVNRRRGFPTDLGRPRPASIVVNKFADTVDEWARMAARKARRTIVRAC